MAEGISINLTGQKELMRAFEKLDRKVQKDASRKAVRAGSVPIFQAAKENLGRVLSDEATGKLQKSMGRRFRTRKGIYYVVIGPRLPEGAHQHWVEYGTGPRFRHSVQSKQGAVGVTQKAGRAAKKKLESSGVAGGSTGSMPAKPFMRPAYDTQKGKAIEEVEKKLREEIFKAG